MILENLKTEDIPPAIFFWSQSVFIYNFTWFGLGGAGDLLFVCLLAYSFIGLVRRPVDNLWRPVLPSHHVALGTKLESSDVAASAFTQPRHFATLRLSLPDNKLTLFKSIEKILWLCQ